METIQQQVRHQQQIEKLCAATVRALSGERQLQMHAQQLYRGQQRIAFHAPHLQNLENSTNLPEQRGLADGMALRLCYSDAELHQTLCPQEPIQRLIFELLEQLRVEALVPEYLPGVQHNLYHRFTSWSHQFHQARLSDGAFGNLLFTLAQICWSRLQTKPVMEEFEDFIEATRAGIVPLLGHDLAALKRLRNQQRTYASAALSIARHIHAMLEAAQAQQTDKDQPEDDTKKASSALRLLLNFEEGDELSVGSVRSGHSKVFAQQEGRYQVFTRAYDREIEVRSLLRPELLQALRTKLDQQVQKQAINSMLLARQFAALFSQNTRDGWVFAEEEGYIDGRRLSQLIASPNETRIFRQAHFPPKPNAVVSVLIDCSGSMKAHIESIAILLDILGRALQLANVRSEILGFSTGAWNGGRAHADWIAQGRKPNPGRLNEVNYLIYKALETSWRQARPAIAALLKPDLFREGIDGEAVDWACARIRHCAEARRILLVISDGCPMDTATNLANDNFYLDNHLQAVVAQHEQPGDVEIYGLGVGLDLSPYYRHNLALDVSEKVHSGLFTELLQLLRKRQA